MIRVASRQTAPWKTGFTRHLTNIVIRGPRGRPPSLQNELHRYCESIGPKARICSLKGCLEIIVCNQPVEPLNFFALTQKEHSGDALNSEALCYRHVAFNVHTINRQPSYVLLGQAFEP